MEIQFQKQIEGFLTPKQSTFNERDMRSTNKSKFVGVRQRPSGKWVAEIKNTTQKIRMWLGTFDTAEEAARAYDEAACLLRGSNTRTNFINHAPSNPALSLKIRNLLNQKKGLKQSPPFSSTTANMKTNTLTSTETSSTSTPKANGLKPADTQMFDEAYKPDLSHCLGGYEMGSSQCNQQSVYTSEYDHNSVFSAQEGGFEAPKRVGLVSEMMSETHQIPEFERMKVERQISASLYAMNGVNEYWENVHDSSDAFWDLPMLCQMFCPS
ncbi:unnamed protein product [Ilex paraguariensis]|uniref:AP2/ERF domain-containing protein n=1 Tax=Ilex paraguariensis TaxID=185542 RepID=A0ABC8S359_9AQUA